MESTKIVHYYIKRIKKKIKKMSVVQKKIIIVGMAALIVGLEIGNLMGHSMEKRKTEEQIEKVTAQMEKENEQKLKEVQGQLEVLQQETSENDKKELPWNLTLINSTHPMPEGYVPELVEIEPGYSVDTRIAEPLKKMLADAEKEGLNIIICSAYRSVERQIQLFNSSVRERINKGMSYWEAYKDTCLNVAIPGKSEHAMGFAVDLISNQYSELDAKQAETKEAQWLEANCYKYGFILRYPPSKTAETGIIYEPWHYRYVGEEDAKKIMETGVTLEEYLHEGY